MFFCRIALGALALTVAVLAGCATTNMAAQQATEEMRATVAGCMQRLQAADTLVPLRGKVVLVLATEKPTLQMLSDERKAGPEEQQAVLVLDQFTVTCAVAMEDVMRRHNYNAEYVALGRELFVKGQARRADLYSGKISFGEYNRVAQETIAYAARRQSEIVAKYQSLQVQQEAANAASDAANMQRAALLRQAFTPQPLSATCYRMGASVTCNAR